MLIVIGCCKDKLPAPAPAADLYTGSLFRQTLGWARSHVPDSAIVVLSARYGFVALDDVIAPYDTRIGDRDAVQPSVLRTSARRLGIYYAPHIVVAAGRAYFDIARGIWAHARWAFDALPRRDILGQKHWLASTHGQREAHA